MMNETHPPRRTGRSIGAVLAGMFVGILLTIGTDIVLHVIGVFPPWGHSMSVSTVSSYSRPAIAPSTASRLATSLRGSHPTGPCNTPWCAAS